MKKYLFINVFLASFLMIFHAHAGKPTPVTTYEIGLPGPAGGIVFHIFDGGGQRYSGQHGLEAAPTDIGQAGWGCFMSEISDARKIAVGTGAQNTSEILANCSDIDSAAMIASNYVLNGFNDWFLPSREDLVLIYRNLHSFGLGNFDVEMEYWSSSEINGYYAWSLKFLTGALYMNYKDSYSFRVRPIRVF